MESEPASAVSTDDESTATLAWGLSARDAAILAGIVVATIAVYLPCLRNGWVSDDLVIWVNNKSIHTWAFVTQSFNHDLAWVLKARKPGQAPASSFYRPLENAWFAANALLFGVNHPAPWHLAKIALHVVAVVLCFRVAQLLTRDVAVALLTAAIFGLMPAHTEPVVWASSIPEPLSTVFELSALLFLIGRKPGWSRGLFISAIFYGFAILTHESAIFFPLVVAAYVLLFESGDAGAGRMAPNAGTRERIVSVCAPFVIVALAYGCARVHALGTDYLVGMPHRIDPNAVHSVAGPNPVRGAATILMTLPMVLITYLAMLALPFMAEPVHSLNWITELRPLVFISWAALIMLAALFVMLVWRSPKRSIYLFCAAWCLFTIAPALKLTTVWWLNQDRYLYAPSFGWSLGVAVTVVQIAAIGSRARIAVGAVMAVLLAAYAVSTIQTESYWYDNLAYFGREVEVRPTDVRFRLGLADELDHAGRTKEATQQLERAEALRPDVSYFHLRLTQEYMKLGRTQDFEREFKLYNETAPAGRVN